MRIDVYWIALQLYAGRHLAYDLARRWAVGALTSRSPSDPVIDVMKRLLVPT